MQQWMMIRKLQLTPTVNLQQDVIKIGDVFAL